jgi:hypothetical protein
MRVIDDHPPVFLFSSGVSTTGPRVRNALLSYPSSRLFDGRYTFPGHPYP